MKRAVDLLGAGVGLTLASPVIGLAALAIKLDDGGPVFYRQRRVGRHGEDFDLVKLRTMIPGAETEGAGWAVDYADPRITRVGRVLRRLSVDELPQTARSRDDVPLVMVVQRDPSKWTIVPVSPTA